MPSKLHEALVDLFREDPSLGPRLLRNAGRFRVPRGCQPEPNDSNMSEIVGSYSADLTVLLKPPGATRPRLVVIVEVQLARDGQKRFSWPMYEAVARARWKCPACLLVLTSDPDTTRWANRHVRLGPSGSRFQPIVVGPSRIPRLSRRQAQQNPELAVLAARAHGNQRGGEQIVLAACAAFNGLDQARASIYHDLIWSSLTEERKSRLESLMIENYEYQSDFAKKHYGEGRAEGLRRAILTILRKRGLDLTEAQSKQIEACSEPSTLDTWLERALEAGSVEQVLSHPS